MLAQACSTESFTQSELDEAYESLASHQEEFLSGTLNGQKLRESTLKMFKDEHPECKDIIQLAICADLCGDVDAKNACIIKMEVDEQRAQLSYHEE